MKHWSSFVKSARWAPLTKVTTLAPIVSLIGDAQLAVAGTQSPRNFASTLPPVIASAVTSMSAEATPTTSTLFMRYPQARAHLFKAGVRG